MIPSPPKLQDLRYGTKLIAGLGTTEIIADFDFETYSEAGFIWNSELNKYVPPHGANKKGLSTVGVAAYAEHPTTEVISLAYNLKDGRGIHHWTPRCLLLPTRLFEYLTTGGLLEAWNVTFESWIWTEVCVKKYGFPELPFDQLRCAMAKARAFSLPGSLDAAGKILDIENKKNKDGTRLLNKFSIPRNPTKSDKRTRISCAVGVIDSPDPDVKALYEYNIQDVLAEAEISSLIPDLSEDELKFWQCDQKINYRGVQLDTNAISNCIMILEKAHKKYNYELSQLTDGAVKYASEVQRIRNWLAEHEIFTSSLDDEHLNELLKLELNPEVRRVLEIRQMIGSASVKKLYAMSNQVTKSGRIHDLFVYHSARTGRAAGTGPQPQNLPNSGPLVSKCVDCEKYFGRHLSDCPWCGSTQNNIEEWNARAAEDAIETMTSRSLECIEYFWGDSIEIISGSLRGLFIAASGHDLICSDYSAIEAVVLAALANEPWRMEVFNTHGKIYEMSASKITGIPFDEFLLYKATSGQHHPMRKKIGKVAELASGYQGWIGAWKQFGADEFFNDDEIKDAILAWREASPKIVEMWGGQQRYWNSEYYGLEGMAIMAVLNPGTIYEYNGIKYLVRGDILYCQLLSGRYITYHRPRLSQSDRRPGTYALSFEGWNTNPKAGAIGWVRMFTYGGKLTENVVQATARDILAHAIINLENAGYPIVLHVHDEIVAEVPKNSGSLEEFERIMGTLPSWASDWPIKAAGGWRGKRYSK